MFPRLIAAARGACTHRAGYWALTSLMKPFIEGPTLETLTVARFAQAFPGVSAHSCARAGRHLAKMLSRKRNPAEVADEIVAMLAEASEQGFRVEGSDIVGRGASFRCGIDYTEHYGVRGIDS